VVSSFRRHLFSCKSQLTLHSVTLQSRGGWSSAYREADVAGALAANEGGEHAGLDVDKSGDMTRIA
jgi:hypothetical protein